MKTLRWVIKYHRWPSRLQRDFMSRDPARRARVRTVAERIIAQMDYPLDLDATDENGDTSHEH